MANAHVRGVGEGRDALGKTQNRQPFGLAHGSSMLSPHSDAPTAQRPVALACGELHPHALRSCYSFEPQALASRSRFVVAGKEERKVCRSQADSTLTLAKDESLLES